MEQKLTETSQQFEEKEKNENQPVKKESKPPTKVVSKKDNLNVNLPENLQNFPIATIEQAQEYAQIIFQSNLAPDHFDSPKDAAVAIMYGKELGIAPITALMNMYVHNGRVGLGIHLYTAKLIQNNIVYSILEDYIPIYSYLTKDGRRFDDKEYTENRSDFQIVTAKTLESDYEKDKIHVIRSLIDYRTTIEFVRIMLVLGEKVKMQIKMSVTLSEYKQMGVVKETGSWAKQPRTMLRSRCLTVGARLIAPDKFSSVYSESEIFDMQGVNYKVSEEGEVIEIIE